MRPLRLTMQAFGPYPNRQIVDFTEALNVGLFGIYGPTGAGKSSIFSAIAFALFGEPAKGEQDLASLRSDHAAADVISEVQLVFDVGAKRYFVRRRPEQVRQKLRSTGATKEPHSAWLFDATGLSLDAISEDNPGKSLAEKKVGDVAQHMLRVLGYSANHFRQIVLLPQGRFETFLVAKTDERLKILRELFDVTLYQKLAKRLKEDAVAASARIQSDHALFNRLLGHEDCATLEALQAKAVAVEAKSVVLKTDLSAAEAAASAAAKALGEADQLNKRFVEAEAAAKALAGVQVQQPAIDRDTQALAGARRAQSLETADEAAATARKRAAAAATSSEEARRRESAATLTATMAAQALEAERGRAAETEALIGRRNDLQRHRQTLGAADAQRQTLAMAAAAVSAAAKKLSVAQVGHDGLVAQRTTKATQLAKARETAEAQAALRIQIGGAQTAYDAAVHYEKAVKELKDAEAAAASAGRQADLARAAEERAGAAFQEAEQKLSDAQAIHLAEKLVDGEPCAVCGALDHPSPAKGEVTSTGLDAAFRAARETLDSARTSHTGARETRAAALASVKERKATLDALATPASSAAMLAEQLRQLGQKQKTLGAAPDLKALQDALDQADRQIVTSTTTLDAARSARERAKTNEALAQQALDTALATIPADLRSAAALDKATGATDAAIAARRAALQAAVDQDRIARDTAVAAKGDVANATSTVSATAAEVTAAQETFAARLAAVELTEAQYRTHKANVARIDSFQQSIATHNERLAAARDRLEQANRNIEGLPRPDLVALKDEHDTRAAARQALATAEAEARTGARRLAELIAKLQRDLAAIAAADEAYGPLGVVAAALNGDNPVKMDLETFAMATMFDRVLEAANVRLWKMSRERYTLQREQDGKSGGRRGLGIAVHDVFTGKARPTATLSGGESFQAALALALGLSDVVESLSGGIRLDMIFIDEGFGSLDAQTLDEALQTLQDIVGQSRALGLISHIDAVQQAIPHGFQIEKTVTGSAIRRRSA